MGHQGGLLGGAVRASLSVRRGPYARTRCPGMSHVCNRPVEWTGWMDTPRLMFVRRGRRGPVSARGHDGLLREIAATKTSAELLMVLRANEQMILSSENTTVYLSEAWDVILQQHHGEDTTVEPPGDTGVPCSTRGMPNVSEIDSNNDHFSGRGNGKSNGEVDGRGSSRASDVKGQQMRTLQGYMLQHTMPLVAEFSPSSISMIARAMVATKTGAASDIVSISSDVQSRLVHFEPRELCMVLWSLSSHPGMDEQEKQGLFKSLAGLVRQGMGMDNFTAKDLSILVWAVGHVAYRDRVLLQAAEEEAVRKHTSFTAEDLSRLFHGFASVNYNPHTLIPHVCLRYSAPHALEEFASRDLALMIVSLGKLVVEPSSGFCKALVARARDLVPVGSKSNVKGRKEMFDVHLNSLVMWSFARLGLKKTSYMTRSLKFVFMGSNLEGHALEDLVAVMWACCRLDVQLTSGQVARLSGALKRMIKQTENRTIPGSQGSQGNNGGQDQLAPALCRGFRYLSMLYSKRKDGGSDPENDAETESNAHLIVDEIFTGGLADRISPWEVASIVVALGAFSNSVMSAGKRGSTKVRPIPLRRIQKYLSASISDVDSTLLPKLTYTIAKLGLANNSAAVMESLSTTIVAKSGVIPAQGLVQIAYSYASMGSKGSMGYMGSNSNVPRAIAPKLMDGLPKLSGKDRARACFSVYQLAKQSGDRGNELHLVCKDMLLGHVTEADVASLDASAVFGLCLAFGSVASRHGTDGSARGTLQELRGWIVDSCLKRVHGITSAKQLAGIQKVLASTKGLARAGAGSASSENLMELLGSRLSQLR